MTATLDHAPQTRFDHSPWRENALCARISPEPFFPEKSDRGATAKQICHQCPVRGECLEQAVRDNERYGIWGGMSRRERERYAEKHGLRGPSRSAES
jgi:WhiB family transcriptional regulator, redox-sensing transcriptional regulator